MPGGVLRAVAVAGLAVTLVSCGKKGPPLPPFVRVPAPPGEFAAARRGDTVAISFLVPRANVDGSQPANVERVEIYAVTAPAGITEQDIRRLGELIATVPVNPTVEPDAPPRPVEGGVDQGGQASVEEVLAPGDFEAVTLPAANTSTAPAVRPGSPLLPLPAAGAPMRVYMAVAVSGRRTSNVARVLVPLLPAPAPPPRSVIHYDDEAVTVEWAVPEQASALAPSGLLPSRPLNAESGQLAYHVYENVAAGSAAAAEGPAERRLTSRPAEAPPFVDPRVRFGEERCYTVRAVQRVGTLTVESDPSPPACVAMIDTFPPGPPSGLTTVPSTGAISLIWDPSDAPDLGGYLVLRGEPGGTLSRITPTPVQETSFRDAVPSGTRVVYAIQAVDRDGNASDPSAPVEDTAR